jgi:DNA end-binding protein Ku
VESIWKGSISFGLVNFPVDLYSAVDEQERVSFRMLHKKDLSPIQYRKFCTREDIEVGMDEIVKGYEVKKGQFAVLEKEELTKLQEKMNPDDRAIEVLKFVDHGSISLLSIEKPYHVVPRKGGERPYAILREALLAEKKDGIVRFFLRTRPHLAALIAGKDAISLIILRPFDEIRNPAKLPIPGREKKAAELEIAKTLIERMTDEWDPREQPDEYKQALLKLLKSKKPSAGAVSKARREEGGEVIDLMEALKRSVHIPSRRAARAKTAPKRTAAVRTARVRG